MVQTSVKALAPFLTGDIDPSIAPPRHRLLATARVLEDKELLPYDPVLDDGGPVMFKVARRVDLKFLSLLARPLYRFFNRSLPKWWPSRPDSVKVPPAPKAELGGFTEDKWYEAVRRCKTPDHQINVLPANRTWPDDSITYRERSCRPLDLDDERNQRVFLAMCRKYGKGISDSQLAQQQLRRVNSAETKDYSPQFPEGFSPSALVVLNAIAENQKALVSIDERLSALESDCDEATEDDSGGG